MKIATLLILALFCPNLQAIPSQVMIIRHAERPTIGKSLAAKGKERAAALAPSFQNGKWDLPATIYAQRPSKQDKSRQSIQTVAPLAEALTVKVNTTYQNLETAKIAQEIRTRPDLRGKVILICWDHEFIPELAKRLGAKNAPRKWDQDSFDRIWLLSYEGDQVKFKDLPQRLLFGDSPR